MNNLIVVHIVLVVQGQVDLDLQVVVLVIQVVVVLVVLDEQGQLEVMVGLMVLHQPYIFMLCSFVIYCKILIYLFYFHLDLA